METKMKKILLSTTAICLFSAGVAHADMQVISAGNGPVITVGGTADFQVGSGSQESLYKNQSSSGVADGSKTSIYSRELHTRTDTNIHLKVDGRADNGLGYGAYIELNADTNANDTTANNNSARRTYIYVESGFGRIETGATGDAGNALKVGAETLAHGTGGIAGDFYKYVDLANGGIANNAKYAILPGLPTAAGMPGEANVGYTAGFSGGAGTLKKDTHDDRANANKISYYTPRIDGLQAGVSFTPDQAEHGTANGFTSANGGASELGGGFPAFIDVWNGGVNYETRYNDIAISTAITGEYGDAKDSGTTSATIDGLEAYSFGLNLSYAGFTIGGSYADAPEFGLSKSYNSSMHYWTLGGAYEFGPLGTSITYLSSTVKHGSSASAPDASFQNVSFGADYKLAPGLLPYLEVSFFETDSGSSSSSTTVDNKGTIFIGGTQLNF